MVQFLSWTSFWNLGILDTLKQGRPTFGPEIFLYCIIIAYNFQINHFSSIFDPKCVQKILICDPTFKFSFGLAGPAPTNAIYYSIPKFNKNSNGKMLKYPSIN
jgi:hypothetical protein